MNVSYQKLSGEHGFLYYLIIAVLAIGAIAFAGIMLLEIQPLYGAITGFQLPNLDVSPLAGVADYVFATPERAIAIIGGGLSAAVTIGSLISRATANKRAEAERMIAYQAETEKQRIGTMFEKEHAELEQLRKLPDNTALLDLRTSLDTQKAAFEQKEANLQGQITSLQDALWLKDTKTKTVTVVK